MTLMTIAVSISKSIFIIVDIRDCWAAAAAALEWIYVARPGSLHYIHSILSVAVLHAE